MLCRPIVKAEFDMLTVPSVPIVPDPITPSSGEVSVTVPVGVLVEVVDDLTVDVKVMFTPPFTA
jgi:hypothetical protein